jgi:heme exporter protein C
VGVEGAARPRGGDVPGQPYLALVWSPPERFQGETYRIFYMHVPQLELGMLGLTINFCCSVAYLFEKSWTTDALAEASAELALYLSAVGVALGSIWAKPTWGTWWTWDPRLISVTAMVLMYAGYLALRRFIEDVEKRATWSAVVGILCSVSVPMTYFSVKLLPSMHQVQSNPSTVDSTMVMAFRFSSFAFLALAFVFFYQRFLIAQESRGAEEALPELVPPKAEVA